MEHQVHDFWGAVASYAAAALALLGTHSSTLMAIGGAILLGARLVIELPKAIKTIKNLAGGKD